MFHHALEEYGGDEHRAFTVAHTAAKRAGENEARDDSSRAAVKPSPLLNDMDSFRSCYASESLREEGKPEVPLE